MGSGGFFGFFWVLMGFFWFFWVLVGSGGFFWVLMRFFLKKKYLSEPIRTHQNLSEPITITTMNNTLFDTINKEFRNLRNLGRLGRERKKVTKFPKLTNLINRLKPGSKARGKGKKRLQTEVWSLWGYLLWATRHQDAGPEAVVSMREITQPRSRAS